MLTKKNPYFTNSYRIEPRVPTVSSFEEIVKTLALKPEQYAKSDKLKDWVKRNKNVKYVPSDLLMAYGFTAETEI